MPAPITVGASLSWLEKFKTLSMGALTFAPEKKNLENILQNPSVC